MTKTVIFLHIPKAAGTTLNAVLKQVYPAGRTFAVLDEDAQGSVARLAAMPAAEKARLRLVKGHWPFGLHEVLECPATYVTLVRDPVDRVVSAYYHILGRPDHYAYRRGFSADMTLEAFVRSGILPGVTHDAQAWYLSGGLGAAGGHAPEAVYERAIEHLDQHFAVAALTERFDEALLLMKERLGWHRVPFYYRRHVNADRPARPAVPEAVRRLIRAQNEVDEALYRHVAARFDDAVRARGRRFVLGLQAFSLANRGYERYRRLRARAGAALREARS